MAFSHMHNKLKSWGGLDKNLDKIHFSRSTVWGGTDSGLESLAGNEYIGCEEGT